VVAFFDEEDTGTNDYGFRYISNDELYWMCFTLNVPECAVRFRTVCAGPVFHLNALRMTQASR
jgi:hypothetical protein